MASALYSKKERQSDLFSRRMDTRTLRFQCIAFPLSSFVVVSNMTMQNIDKPWRAMFLSLTRQGLFFVPAVFLLTRRFGIIGVETAQMVSDVLAFAVTLPIMLPVLKELRD